MNDQTNLYPASVELLEEKAAQLRIDCVRATTEAGSGHPTSCASAADIVSTLFFAVMRFDPKNPRGKDNDVFVLSKGHAAPLLYAAWAEVGAFPREKLLTLRKVDSDLEGHPVPHLPFVDAATGSLGQGLSIGVGIALNAKRFQYSDQRVYVLIGDGESAEGAIWEAAQWASLHQLENLCVTLDINRLGQSQPTMLEHHLKFHQARWEAFGWQAIPVDGHNIPALLSAYETAANTIDRPTIILARTFKGEGLLGIENTENWHGKALDPETARQVIHELEKHTSRRATSWVPQLPPSTSRNLPEDVSFNGRRFLMVEPPYSVGDQPVATRKGFGEGLKDLAAVDPQVVVIDGDVKNSTYTEEFAEIAPDRFLQGYIAEQNMVGIAMGLAARGLTPFVSTFACFLTRAYDFVRMTAISGLNVKFVGTHAGVSIGEDGPSQMGLEDLAMMCAQPNITVLYPADATSAWRAVWLSASHSGPCYLRMGRPKSPILYGADESFAIGKCKVLRKSENDRALVVTAGITVFEALTAYEELKKLDIAIRVIDLFSIQPIDREELIASAREADGIVITVEDHYSHGGLGDAVFSVLTGERVLGQKLSVREIPRSGKSNELIARYGISSRQIVECIQSLCGKKP